MSFLTLSDVSKQYENDTVLKNFSMSAKEGEITVLLGPSGCGKSTILKMIIGMENPDSGDITVNGISICGIDPAYRQVGIVPQKFGLSPFHTVRQTIELSARNRIEIEQQVPNNRSKMKQWIGLRVPYCHTDIKQQQSELVQEYTELCKIGSFLDAFPSKLSGGQQQRVALARGLVRGAPLLLLDEPLSQLDTALRGNLRQLILELRKKCNLTILLVTHDMNDARRMADWIIVIDDTGTIQQQGTFDEIFDSPKNEFVSKIIGRTET